MDASERSRQKYWSFVFAWVALIYGTLYVVRPVCTFLQNTTPFALLVNILMYSLLTVLILGLFVKRKVTFARPLSCLVFLITAGAYICGFSVIQIPEEKLHFLEYGILAYLAFRASELDIRRPPAFVYAFLLTVMFGWIDEGIQYFLPNRYYQNEDVALNAAGGLLGLAVVYIIRSGHAKATPNKNGNSTI